MKAGAVIPGQQDSAKIVEVEVPELAEDEVLVKILEVGINGTDIEINRGQYGQPPLLDCARTLPVWARVSRAPLEFFVSFPLSSP